MLNRRIWRNIALTLGAAIIIGAAASFQYWGPLLIFDLKRPARDNDSEFENGKEVAWGPHPANWLLRSNPAELLLLQRPKRTFAGDEWYFVMFRSFCIEWVTRNGYTLPSYPNPIPDDLKYLHKGEQQVFPIVGPTQ